MRGATDGRIGEEYPSDRQHLAQQRTVTESLRAAHRLLKVARSLADLEQADGIRHGHMAERLQ
ncbi:hypothetical protein BLL36_21200 [Pseudomonas cedrina subsp. cedrina]|uniref:Mg chelatase-related protein C-terminal domain-containing protein n=1 Tax=Pseudomonas cedrina subsp. cedrina TaxID=76762 RepID=A0A1V2K1V7_PSECE|nr:hypothetical protein BLL36_21200 [Pseudomonas cedrina subsp. cedrina]